MRRFPALAPLLAASVFGCAKEDTAPVNAPPTVSWVERPVEGSTLTSSAGFAWSGTDSDGSIARYEWSLDSETAFTGTSETRVDVSLTKALGTDSSPQAHVFRVRAVDDRGLAGLPIATGFVVAVLNDPPVVTFTEVPAESAYAGAMVMISWMAEDPDGSIDIYEYAVDDPTGVWIKTRETSLTLDFSSASFRGELRPLHDPRLHTFHLRALDNEGKRSEVIMASFLSGPENVPPRVTLTGAPFTVTGESALFTWTGEDADGEIAFYEWGVSQEGPPVWQNAGLSLERRIAFTRADGPAEAPERYTFYLRASDDDSARSTVATHDFQVAIPNERPSVVLRGPNPTLPVHYDNITVSWTGVDDGEIARYEHALDDTSVWVAVPPSVTLLQRDYACPNPRPFSPPEVPATPVDTSFGDHTVYVRAFDTEGLMSDVACASFRTFTVTPFTTIEEPVAPDGAVTGSEIEIRWRGLDYDRPLDRMPHHYRWKAFVVSDFPDDAREAVLGDASAAVDLGPGVTSLVFSGDPGLRYILAVFAVDEAEATEPHFLYGRNVLKITVP